MKLKIKEIREAFGLSTYQMAERMKCTQATYSRFERAKTKTDLNRLEEFARALNMSIVDVITYPERYVLFSEKERVESIPEVTIQLKVSEKKRDTILAALFDEKGIEIIKKI